MVEIGNARKALAAPAYPTPRACRHGAWRSGVGNPTGAPDVTAARGKGWVAAAAGQWERQHTTGNERATHEIADRRGTHRTRRRTEATEVGCRRSAIHCNRRAADRNARPVPFSNDAASARIGSRRIWNDSGRCRPALAVVFGHIGRCDFSDPPPWVWLARVPASPSIQLCPPPASEPGRSSTTSRPRDRFSGLKTPVRKNRESPVASRGCMACLRIDSCLRLWGKRWGGFWLFATAAAAGAQCEEVSAQPISRVSSYPFRKIADGGLCAAALTRYVGLA